MYIQYIMENHIYFLTVILVILVCFFLFRYLSNDYLEYRKLNPYLIEHEKQIGNVGEITNSKYMIRKSIDQHHGMEFTYAFWFKIDAVHDKTTRYNILSKGNETNVCPGVYIMNDSENNNTIALHVDISIWPNKHKCDKYTSSEKDIHGVNTDCVNNLCNWKDNKCVPWECGEITKSVKDCKTPADNEPCCSQLSDYCNIDNNKCVNKDKVTAIVNNLPIQKWTHAIIMLVGNYLDIFINGNLYERFEIKGVAKQNNEDLVIGKATPASGSIMRLQYFNYAIPASKINKIISKTEITKDVTKEYEDESTTDYLDRNYWIGENTDPNKRLF